MARYTKNDQPVGETVKTGLNTELANIQTAIGDTLSRKGDSPNAMEADLDMNSNDILNAASIKATSLDLNGQVVTNFPTIVYQEGEAKYFDTVADMQLDSTLRVGDVVILKDRANSVWDVITATTNNGYDTLDGTASGVSLQLRLGPDVIHASHWGVKADYDGVSGTDNTAALQDAISYVLNSDKYKELVLPAGRILYSTLQTYEPGSSNQRAQRGKITISGQGALYASDLFGTTTQHYGTELVSTNTTGADITVSDGDTKVRDTLIRNLSLVSQTSGYAIKADYCPEFEMQEVGIRVTNVAGSGVLLKDVFFSRIDNCKILADAFISNTGSGIEFSSTIFAGLHEVVGSTQIDNFQDSYFVNGGTNWTSITWQNSACQNHSQYGWRIEGPVWNFSIENCYVETGSGVSHIYSNLSSGSIRNLSIDGLFLLGGDSSSAWITGPAIDLNDVDSYNFKNLFYFRPYTSLLNVTESANFTVGKIECVSAIHDNTAALPAGPLYMFTGNTEFSIDSYKQTSTSKIEKFDATAIRETTVDSTGIKAHAFSVGPVEFQSLSTSVYDMANDNPRPMIALCTCTGAGASAIRLPRASSVNESDMRYVYNDPASTQSLQIRNGSLGGAIATLAPGEGAVCHADMVNDKWLIIQATASYGT